MSRHRTKTWRRTDLLVDDTLLRRRCADIQDVSRTARCVPRTDHLWTGDTLVQRQAEVRAASLPAGMEARPHLDRLAADLDALSSLPVHGDITLKNLLFDGRRLFLVDWEPAHHQLRDGRRQWMVSEPWVALVDRRSGVLSSATDRIGFFAIAWQLLFRPHRITDRRAFARAHHLGRAHLVPVDETELATLSWGDIVALAAASPRWRWVVTSGTWA